MTTEDVLRALKREDPKLRDVHDAVVAALLVIMKDLQFHCVGFGESDKTERDDYISVFPPGWNSLPDLYVLRYKHNLSERRFLFKFLKMGPALLVCASASDSPETVHTMEVSCQRFAREDKLAQPDELYTHLEELDRQFREHVLHKLLPLLASVSMAGAQPFSRAPPATGGTYPGGNRGDYEDDPLRIGPPRRPNGDGGYGSGGYGGGGGGGWYGSGLLPGSGPGFGDADRLPMGGHPLVLPGAGRYPIGPYPGGGGPMGPSGSFPMGGGMYPGSGGTYPGGGGLMGPRDPRFGPLPTDPFAFDGPSRNGNRPPGARFDPYGPPGLNRPGPDPDHEPPRGTDTPHMYL